MKVFLSWSGNLSHQVALELREWLPSVIQSISPYVSSEDIDKGTRWSTDIAKELEDSAYGIICVTMDNLGAPWINFEAGALSKIIDKSNVSPLLVNIKKSDVQGPLVQFQLTILEKADVLKLLHSINNRALEGERLKDAQLNKSFEAWWPQLETSMSTLIAKFPPEGKATAKPQDKNAGILEELLELARNQQRLLGDPPSLLPPEYLARVLDRFDSPHRYSSNHFDDISYEYINEKIKELMELYGKMSSLCDENPIVNHAHNLTRHVFMHLQNPREHKMRLAAANRARKMLRRKAIDKLKAEKPASG